MTRRSPLVIATANEHKLREYRALLHGVPGAILGMDAFGIDAPEETGETFRENALLKARACAEALRTDLSVDLPPCIADDSGLEVDALGGEPGVRSNRWAGPGRSDADRTRLLLDRLGDVPEEARGARFVCVIAVVTPDGEERTFEGVLEGRIAPAPRGSGGFGYDPVMYVPELDRTVAELSEAEKNAVSHRGRAAAKARAWLIESMGTTS